MVKSLAYFRITLKYPVLNVCGYCEVYCNKYISNLVIFREIDDEELVRVMREI